MNNYIVLVRQDPEYSGSNTWWRKGDFTAESPEAAVRLAYAGSYLSPNRKRNPLRHDRVAVTGPGHVWEEFEITLRALPAKIVSVEPREHEPFHAEDVE